MDFPGLHSPRPRHYRVAFSTYPCENGPRNPWSFLEKGGTPVRPTLEGPVTHALEAIRSGDAGARDRLACLIYDELRRMADRLMHAERPGHTLQPTALAHEVLLRLLGGDALALAANRRHLFGSAAQAMREVLVDHARRRKTEKRGGTRQCLPLDAVLAHFEERDLDVVSLHEALEQLAAIHDRPARVVTLRFFGGLSVEDVAAELDLSASTVEADFRIARAWLRKRMVQDDDP